MPVNTRDSSIELDQSMTSLSEVYVGVTGHRDINPVAIPLIRQSIDRVLKSIGQSADRKIFLSSLAEGADQIAAEIAISLGYELQVPLPFERDSYIADFPIGEKSRFERLESSATRVFVVTPIEDNTWNLPSKDWLYRQAGLYIANKCNALIALWDGRPSTGSMCGTADILNYIESSNPEYCNSASKKKRLFLIATPRAREVSLINVGKICEIES